MKILKEVTFDAAHYLPNYDGKCKNMHGHTYKVRANLSGPIDADTGMLFDFATLNGILILEIIERYDHKCLNDFLENPTAENMAIEILKNLLEYRLLNKLIDSVEVWETPTSCAIARYRIDLSFEKCGKNL